MSTPSVTSSRRRLHALISGRVHGVGFRVFVLRRAQMLGLTGRVRNLYFPARQVEVIAEGPEEALEQLLAALRRGPSAAEVTRVDVSWEPATGEFLDFDIG